MFEKISFTPPENLNIDNAPVNKDNIKWKLPENYKNQLSNGINIYKLKNVYITEDGVVVKKFNVFKKSLVYPSFTRKFNDEYAYNEFKKDKINYKQSICLLFDHWSVNNYYHWTIDSLSRLCIILNNYTNTSITIIIPENAPAFVFSSLEAFPEVNITLIKNNTIAFCKEIIMPDYPIVSGFLLKDYGMQIRDRILNHYTEIKKMPVYTKIYASRSKQKIRRIINESYLIDFLKNQGFAIINFEDYGYWQQIKIMENATILIGAHGSNMVNMLYMKPDSTIIEMNKEQTESATLCYRNIAHIMNFRYYYIPLPLTDNNFIVDDNSVAIIMTILKHKNK